MTKLRYDRHVLRLLDNIRRENALAVRAADVPLFTRQSARTAPRRLRQPRNEVAYRRHIEAFDRLPMNGQKVLEQLLDLANAETIARTAVIQKLGNQKRKAALEEASHALRSGCIAFHKHCRAETIGGKSVTREWFAKLRVVMGSEWQHFEDLDALLVKTRSG